MKGMSSMAVKIEQTAQDEIINKETIVSSTIPATEDDPVEDIKESLRLIEDLKFFLATAPANWQENQVIRRYYLNNEEGFVSCVFWNNLYFVTGTDIVRCIVYKFEHFGRKIIDRKKFEEGIFSDLRNLKCGTDAILEPPRSEFLEFLFKNSCLRTQKKQKVFFWFNVPHDKLMADALERDLKKEKLGQSPTTIASREPAKSFQYDESSNLFTQLAEHMETQKKANEEVYNLEPSDTNDNEKSSPEYSTSTNIGKVDGANENYDFLTQETPLQYKEGSDYEDDFPLDYFDQDGKEEYITLDPNFQLGGYSNAVDDNYEAILDPSIFIYSANMTPATAMANNATYNQVAYNDEYLIEQTQPLKTPLPPISASSLQPKSAKFVSLQSSSEDFFPSFLPPPLSAKYQGGFSRGTPTQIFYPNPTQATPEGAYDYASHQYYANGEGPVTYIHHEQEYWPQPPSATYGGSYETLIQMPYNQQYVIMNEQDHPYPGSAYQVMNPSLMNTIPPPSATGQSPYHFAFSSPQGNPSMRQQQISAKMMKKRQIIQSKTGGIGKPISLKEQKNPHFTIEEIANQRTTRVIHRDNYESLKSPNDSFMPTPLSSAQPSDDKR
ncbi:STE like transcription factor-domain-containing protein [Scheffersomyces xylosifermentans]|uniref:STE like transcription factor-domain-containing protein n=1 Tax=Scheffersomyces xylosifermentans TaxID=1304137 RepID=UPI00315CBA93